MKTKRITVGDRVRYNPDLCPEMADIGPGTVVEVLYGRVRVMNPSGRWSTRKAPVAIVEFDRNRFSEHYESQVHVSDLVLVPSVKAVDI